MFSGYVHRGEVFSRAVAQLQESRRMSAYKPAAAVSIAPDTTLALLGLALMLVGLVAISSASIEYADWHYQNPWFHTERHLVWDLVLALVAGVLTYRIAPTFWLETGWVWLFVALALLILVLIPGIGREVNGSQRWLPLGPFTLQPSGSPRWPW